jgi:hypothetical protein
MPVLELESVDTQVSCLWCLACSELDARQFPCTHHQMSKKLAIKIGLCYRTADAKTNWSLKLIIDSILNFSSYHYHNFDIDENIYCKIPDQMDQAQGNSLI